MEAGRMRKRVKKNLQMWLVVLGLSLTCSGVCRAETYEQWLSKCTSYEDVAKWQERYLLYDLTRLKDSMHHARNRQEKLKANSPEVTFNLKRGVCMDAAVFSKVSLNRINADYKAEIIYLLPERIPDHYVCGFYINGKLYIMDYGTTYRNTMGTHGPFESLDEYVHGFYLRYHPKHRTLKRYHFGWPPWRSFEPW
jgi:hypothetical protein